MVNGVGYHLRVPSKMIIIKNLDDQDHYDHDDDDQDVDDNDHFAEAKRLLEIRSRARFRPMNGEVLHVGQRTTADNCWVRTLSLQGSHITWPTLHCQILAGGIMTSMQMGHSNSFLAESTITGTSPGAVEPVQ